jgi:hypothetical protein
MSKHFKLRFLALSLCVGALAAAYESAKSEELMVHAAERLIESLDRFQKPKTVFKFDAADRTNWHYFPEGGFTDEYGYSRNGLTLRAMAPKQRHFAHGLMSTGLSAAGYVKAMDVMALEEIVRAIEDDKTGHRDALGFHYSVFGEPSLTGTWGWRVEGHHLSLHYTLRNGELVAASPTFFGANPHEAAQGPHKGMRALADEEDLALELLASLDKAQKKVAVIDDVAPYDILTMADERAKLEGAPQGLAASKMTEKQYGMLLNLIAEYAHNMPAQVAAARMKAAQDVSRDQLYFAWAGRIGRPKPKAVPIGSVTTGNREPNGNYYRVQSPTFLIEYDNTQNVSNHSHSVWREFEGDYGLDVLAMHHRRFDHGLRGGETTAD